MTVKANAASFLVLMLSAMAGPFSMQMFLPALPAIQRSFGVSQSVVQLTLTLSMVAIAFSTLLYGPLSDRFGRKPVLVGGMLLFLAGSVLSTVAPSVALLILGRVVQAAGAAAGMVLSRAIVRDAYGAAGAPKAIHYLTMATVTAPMIAPVAGGFLTDGFGWRANFAVTTAIAVLIAALVAGLLRETLPAASRAGDRGGSVARAAVDGLRQVAQSRSFWGYALISSFSTAIFFAFVSGAPYLMNGLLERPASEYGLWFMGVPALFVVGNFAASRLLNTLGLDRSIVLGAILCAITLAVAAGLFGMLPLTPALLFVPAYAISFFQGLVIANGVAGAINASPAAFGAASGLLGFTNMTISAVAAQVTGTLVRDSVWPMIAIMALCAGAVLILLPMIRRRAPMPDRTAVSPIDNR